jgi:hypothetical protein
MKKTSELLVKTTLNSGILNYFLSQGDFIALGRIRIRFFFRGRMRIQSNADQHRHLTKKTTDSSYVYYDCRGATVGERGP